MYIYNVFIYAFIDYIAFIQNFIQIWLTHVHVLFNHAYVGIYATALEYAINDSLMTTHGV